MMRRREVITLLGGAAAAWPLAAQAQQMPVVGFLYAGSPEANEARTAGFRRGLSEAGFVEGQNVAIEYRWAREEYGRLPELAAELVQRRVAVMAALGSAAAALAAKSATSTIPVVFAFGGDPVQLGLVASFNRPGGNFTGLSLVNIDLAPKMIGLLYDLLPKAMRFAALVNPANPTVADTVAKDAQQAAVTIGRQVAVFSARTRDEVDAAFTDFAQQRIDAVMVAPDALFFNRRVQLVTLATRRGLPAIYSGREYPLAGGLMSYGADLVEQFRQAGVYAGRLLKGEKAAELPVMRPTKFEFVINLHTAKTFGLTAPTSLLAIADEVIE